MWLRIGQFALDGIEGNVPWTFHVDGIELHVRHLFYLFKSIILGHFVLLKRQSYNSSGSSLVSLPIHLEGLLPIHLEKAKS